MEVTPERIDAARDAARRCLTAAHVTALELSHLWPEAEAGGDWRRFSANAAGVFAALRRDAETAETALDAEALDCIKLAAGILPGYPVGQWVAPTAHEGAMHAASAVYAALWAGDAVGGPASAEILNPPGGFSRGRREEWLLKLLADLPDAQQRRYWAAVIEAGGLVDIPANLAAGIEAEWAAARRALAADARPRGDGRPSEPEAGKAAGLLRTVADALERGEWPTPELRGVAGELLHGPARPDGTRPAGWLAGRFTRLTREARPEALPERHALRAALETLGKVAADRCTDERHPQAAATLRAAADALGGATAGGAPPEKPAAPRAPHPVGYCVRLSQAAAMVGRHKRTLAGWQANDEDFPLPFVEGGGGKPAEWEWTALRPYLERKTGKSLPEYHPSDPNRPDFGDATFWETEGTDEDR